MASAPVWNEQCRDWIKRHFPSQETTILDVGAGYGKYGKLLGDTYKNVDAIELWEDHIAGLKPHYRNVFQINAMDFDYETHHYDLVILGDMLEHLTVTDAQALLGRILPHSKEVMIAIPFEYPQHILYNNVLEIHLQPDLNPLNIKERYPYLHPLFCNYNPYLGFKGIGVYIKTKPANEERVLVHGVSPWGMANDPEFYLNPENHFRK